MHTTTHMNVFDVPVEQFARLGDVLDGEYGLKNLSMSVPVVLGPDGIHNIIEYNLAEDEREGLKVTVNTLKAAAKVVEEGLS